LQRDLYQLKVFHLLNETQAKNIHQGKPMGEASWMIRPGVNIPAKAGPRTGPQGTATAMEKGEEATPSGWTLVTNPVSEVAGLPL